MRDSTRAEIEFVRARIADDERAALEAGAVRYDERLLERSGQSRPHAVHIARQSPERVLVECEAKRKMLEVVADDIDHTYSGDLAVAASQVLDFLAAPYADHPDFRKDWTFER